MWSTYLVEHYRPGLSVEALKAAAAQVQSAVEKMAAEGMPLRYVRSTVIPHDEGFFCVFDAELEELVREAYIRAGVSFERISTAISIE